MFRFFTQENDQFAGSSVDQAEVESTASNVEDSKPIIRPTSFRYSDYNMDASNREDKQRYISEMMKEGCKETETISGMGGPLYVKCVRR